MNEQIIEIGRRLAGLREDCGYSVSELARALEISEDEYIAYENGQKDFSFSFLYNAAEFLKVDVLDIMRGDSPTLSICSVVRKGEGYSVKHDQQYDYKHLAYTFRNKKSEPFLVTVEPRDDAPVLHEHDGQEFNYVISGKMKFYIGDISYELNKGDSVYFDASVPHAEKAIGDKPTQFIAVVLK